MIQESYNTPFITKADFDSLRKTIEDGFLLADDKFIKIDRKFDYLTESMMANFDRVYERFDLIDVKFDKIDKRFNGIDTRLDKLDAGFNGFKSELDLIKKHVIAIHQHLGIKDATISA